MWLLRCDAVMLCGWYFGFYVWLWHIGGTLTYYSWLLKHGVVPMSSRKGWDAPLVDHRAPMITMYNNKLIILLYWLPMNQNILFIFLYDTNESE